MPKTVTQPKTMAELVDYMGDRLVPFAEGEIVEVTILSISKDNMIVDVAGLATGLIPEKEFSTQGIKYNPGDKIQAYVLSTENTNGYVILSLKKAEKEKLWRILEHRNNEGEIINVKIVQANNGGLVAEYNDTQGFIPVSQLSAKHYPRVGGDRGKIKKKLLELVGNTLTVKIISYDKATKKIIFSEKAAVDIDLEEKAKQFQVGQKVKGKITGIVDFGLFVDLGEIEGLVHISQVSWQRINNLKDHFNVGDEIEAEVINADAGRVSLSIKKLLPDPWQSEVKTLGVGSKVEGLVTQVTPYGAFVKLSDNLEGLFHVSQMGSKKPNELVQDGQTYKFEIISIEPELRKISLKLEDDSAQK